MYSQSSRSIQTIDSVAYCFRHRKKHARTADNDFANFIYSRAKLRIFQLLRDNVSFRPTAANEIAAAVGGVENVCEGRTAAPQLNGSTDS